MNYFPPGAVGRRQGSHLTCRLPFLRRRVSWSCSILLVGIGLGFGWGNFPVWAERFLTVEEALTLCFPNASSFEERSLILDRAQAKAVSKKSGVKTQPGPYRCWLARRETNLLGLVFWDQVLGKHDWIDYMVALDAQGVIKQVEVLEYREHYGGEIRQPKWRAQFQGKTAVDPLKLSHDIYNISGATISCRHVTRGIKRLLVAFDLVGRSVGAGPADDGVRLAP